MSSTANAASLPPAPRPFTPPSGDAVNEKNAAAYFGAMDSYVADLDAYIAALENWTPVEAMQTRLEKQGAALDNPAALALEDENAMPQTERQKIVNQLNQLMDNLDTMRDPANEAGNMKRAQRRSDLQSI